jgi:hypothetical protein
MKLIRLKEAILFENNRKAAKQQATSDKRLLFGTIK